MIDNTEFIKELIEEEVMFKYDTETTTTTTYLRPDEVMPVIDFKQQFEYEWYHIPTGKSGDNKVRLYTRLEFLEALNTWNKNGGNQWLYTEK